MILLVLIIFCLASSFLEAFTKVLVPAVYREWENGAPSWVTDEYYPRFYNYSVFLYQRTDPDKPNYIRNRGTEGAVYLRYIVDHYENFPDVAMFVHAEPRDHQEHFLDVLGCINPNGASYMNINFQYRCTTPETWPLIETWVEQCWRDTLRIVWGVENNTKKFNGLLPIHQRISVCFAISQQFILSRDMVRTRPLSVWKKLLMIVNEQDVCHEGLPDYDNLYIGADQRDIGAEKPDIDVYAEQLGHGWGRHVQGGMMEHLAHIIFGHKSLDLDYPLDEEICHNFLPNCFNSPCNHLIGPLFHELDVGE